MAIVQDVIDQALDLVEMTNETGASGFAVTNRLQDAFNQGLSRLHYTLAEADEDWFHEEAEITVSASTRAYSLPDGTLYSAAKQFWKMKQVYLLTNNRIYTLPKFQRPEVSGWEATGPRVSGTLRILYIPAYVKIARDDWTNTELPDGQYPPGWEDYVALFIAARLAIREQDYERASVLAAERDQVLLHIMQHMAPRDVGNPDRVMDVTDRWLGSRLHEYYNQNWFYRLAGDEIEIIQPSALPI